MRRTTFVSWAILIATLSFASLSPAQALKAIQLPSPQKTGGRPLMQVFSERKSTREFGAGVVPPQTLSNLLWAAYGINRPDGHRTAPSAMNRQEVSIYVVTAEGTYLYDAAANGLNPVSAGDHRAATGTQDFVKNAAVNLVYVADLARFGQPTSADASIYAAADVGFIAQNVYLYCASENLATVVRASIDKPALAKILGLNATQKIVLAQSVGYARK